MSLEADTFDDQHAVTKQPLNPLLLKLLQQVGTVAGEGVHGHSASGRPGTTPLHLKAGKGCTDQGHLKCRYLYSLFGDDDAIKTIKTT